MSSSTGRAGEIIAIRFRSIGLLVWAHACLAKAKAVTAVPAMNSRRRMCPSKDHACGTDTNTLLWGGARHLREPLSQTILAGVATRLHPLRVPANGPQRASESAFFPAVLTNAMKPNCLPLDLHGSPLRVNRVIQTERRSLPLYPYKQTISEPILSSHAKSEKCAVVYISEPAHFLIFGFR